MRNDFRDRSHLRFIILFTGLCPLLTLLRPASAQAAPIVTQYQLEGSKESIDYTATVDLQNGYVSGTQLGNSSYYFLSFSFVQVSSGTTLGTVQFSSPAVLNGSIDLESVTDTTFSVTGPDGIVFSDDGGVPYLTVPPSANTCPPTCIVHQKTSLGSLYNQVLPLDFVTPPQGGPPVAVSEPSTLMLMFGALAALVLVCSKRFRRLLASRSATAL